MSTQTDLAKLNINRFSTLEAFLAHVTPELGDYDLTLVGDIAVIVEASFDVNGYIKFSNGFILQWGKTTMTAVGTTAVTFPIPFPTACINAHNTHIYASASSNSGGDNNDVVSVPTTTGFIMRGGNGVGQFWFALGY